MEIVLEKIGLKKCRCYMVGFAGISVCTCVRAYVWRRIRRRK